MLWKERQKKVEELTYNSLECIAEEMGVTTYFYPEVYWVGKKLKFKSLGLPYSYKEEFNVPKKGRGSIYLIKPKIILIGVYSLEDIGEETGHFLHLNNSDICLKKIRDANDFCLNAIVEMFGFFCSKLIAPSRKNELRKHKDPLDNLSGYKKIVRERILSLPGLDHKYALSSEVYQQGYDLGEKLFNAYISGVIPKQEIRKLFANPLSKRDEPFEVFLGLKYNMAEFMNHY